MNLLGNKKVEHTTQKNKSTREVYGPKIMAATLKSNKAGLFYHEQAAAPPKCGGIRAGGGGLRVCVWEREREALGVAAAEEQGSGVGEGEVWWGALA